MDPRLLLSTVQSIYEDVTQQEIFLDVLLFETYSIFYTITLWQTACTTGNGEELK